MQPTAPIAAAKALFAAVTTPGVGESTGRDEWLDVLSSAQEAINVLSVDPRVGGRQVLLDGMILDRWAAGADGGGAPPF